MADHAVYLPGYHSQLNEDAIQHSIDKLNESKEDLQLRFPAEIKTHPCVTLDDTLGYRCKCTFQLIRDECGRLQYCMREKGRAFSLGSSRFPIANLGIQNAMESLLVELNVNSDSRSAVGDHLTSVSFASSWNESDVIVTAYYDSPIEEQEWVTEAKGIRNKLNLLKFSGRSKGRLVSVPIETVYLRDTLWLDLQTDTVACGRSNTPSDLNVDYEKPETAFFHPNPHAMTKALSWMLTRIRTMSTPKVLLELYCGCGAHTIALANSGLLTKILAIELDQRLVHACNRNIALNQHQSCRPRTPVAVVQGDAGKWAKNARIKQSVQTYDILLVDPPRQGLDEQVCRLAIEGRFQHILYVSCGRVALKRDLEILMPYFDVVDCQLFDLFPRTDSIESVVHLQSRK